MNKHTERSYRTGQTLFRQWAETEPAEATRQQIEEYVEWMQSTGKSAKTIRSRLAAISAVHQDKTITNGLALPPIANSIESYENYPAMPAEQFVAIMQAIPDNDIETRLLMMVMGIEGLRVGDAINLTWAAFNWEWMDSTTAAIRDAWRAASSPSDYVFTMRHRSSMIKRLSKYWPDAHRLHMLRKHAARRWIAMRLDSLEVARRLGHNIDNELVLVYTGGWQ